MNINRARCIVVITALLFLGILPVSSNGQSFELGVGAGLNMSSHVNKFFFTDGEIDLQFNPKVTVGYQGGVIIRRSFTQSLRLQVEPSIILLGANYDDSFTLRGSEFETDSRTELLYIQLPILLQLSTKPPSKTVFGRNFIATTYHISGGFYGGYLPYAKFTGTNTGAPIGIPFEGNFSNDVLSQYSEFDGGAILGVGVEHGNNSKVGFEIRAIYSFIDSGEKPAGFEPQNMALTFSVYYMF
ncbi:porin family protein [Fodinibius saliphilus]|uniref:porin family protein n=1 Tax=Fodinibius saliphilus TaxID=1920650 RepID=UPI0011094C1A|nr:porin family protein [Fodinibius saliphilus]